jgi:hypothetical protein
MRSPLRRRILMGLLALPFVRHGAAHELVLLSSEQQPLRCETGDHRYEVRDDLVERWNEWRATRQVFGQPPRASLSKG